jgi:hypothetical protein
MNSKKKEQGGYFGEVRLFKSKFQEMGNVMYHKDEEIHQLATWCLSKRLICTLEHM